MNVHNRAGACGENSGVAGAVVNYATIDDYSSLPYHRELARYANGGWCASWVASMEHHPHAASEPLQEQCHERMVLPFLQRYGVLPLFLNYAYLHPPLERCVRLSGELTSLFFLPQAQPYHLFISSLRRLMRSSSGG